MRAEYINAYVLAAKQLFDVMFSVKRFERTTLKTDAEMHQSYEVSSVIGVTGDCSGAVVLCFSKEVATRMVSQLVGEEISNFEEDTCDVIGEMLNIIAGNANRELELGAGTMAISVPTVFVGKEHRVKRARNVPCILIGFDTDLGEFAIYVRLECV
jgi:chemotaxis protein CheX